jgi:hypothetical protein
VYLLWYFDGKEYTGERRWDAFRRWRLWRLISPVVYHIPNHQHLNDKKSRRLFVAFPGDTIISLVWSIGLHGGRLDAFSDHLHYIVPPFLMAIPILRDILMWSGAVTWRETPMETCILSLLQAGKSVCIAPSGFGNVLMSTFETERIMEMEKDVETTCVCTTKKMSDELLSFCLHEKIELVPIVIRNERTRYWFPDSVPLRAFQRVMYQTKHAFPFPFVFFYRFWAQKKPPMLQIQFGPVMVCNQENKESLWRIVHASVQSLSCTALGDPEIQFL